MEGLKKKMAAWFESRADEEEKILKTLRNVPREARILDAGCGYGRNIRLLQKRGFKNITGVEINSEIVVRNRNSGIRCFEPEAFFESHRGEEFDVILMSHVIEHFGHKELKVFLEKYLELLKGGGILVIVTPVLTKFFYDDFDHVKPYDPVGLDMLFSGTGQIQFYSRYRLKLEKLYFRRGQFRLKYFSSLYLDKHKVSINGFFFWAVNFFLLILFKLTGGILGQVTGWVGSYQKIEKP